LSRTARPPKITLRSAVGDNMMIRGSAKMVLEIIRETLSLIAVLSATAKALRLAVLTKVRQYRRERNCSFVDYRLSRLSDRFSHSVQSFDRTMIFWEKQ
jgi:hypothetical protein